MILRNRLFVNFVVSKLPTELESREGPAAAYRNARAVDAASRDLQDTQSLMMREVAHSIISNSMCHFHSEPH